MSSKAAGGSYGLRPWWNICTLASGITGSLSWNSVKEGQSMHYPSRRARRPHSQGDLSVSDSVHAGGGVVHDLAPVLRCKPAKRRLHELLRLGPDRRRVRIVRGPHGMVRRIAVETIEKDRFVDEGRVHLALDVVTRFEAQLDCTRGAEPPPYEIHPPHEVGHPRYVIFSRDNRQLGKTL